MCREDLQQINLLQSKAFTEARFSGRAGDGRVPLCRPSFLQMYLAANPDGCFVLAEKSRIFAYCFSRLWGSVSWLGPLAVLPAEQGKGFGKEIVQTAIAHLQARGARVIGLELEASANKNFAFYTKLGFRFESLALDLIMDTEGIGAPRSGDMDFVRLSAVTGDERRQLLREAAQFSDRICPGLDYTSEIELAAAFGYGDAMLALQNGRIAALVIAHTKAYSEQEKQKFLKVNVLQAAAPAATGSGLDLLLNALATWAGEEEVAYIYMRAPLRCEQGLAPLLARGFRIGHNDVRMTLSGYGLNPSPAPLDFSKWQ